MKTRLKPCSCSQCNGKLMPIYKNVYEQEEKKQYCKSGYFRTYPQPPIKKESKKRAQENREYRKEKIPEGQICEFPGCTAHATDKHHTKGRIGALLTDKTHRKYLCREHHEWITTHSKEAIEMGISEYRNRA